MSRRIPTLLLIGLTGLITILSVPWTSSAAGSASVEQAASRLGEGGEDLIDELLASPFKPAPAAARMARMRSDLAQMRSHVAPGDGEAVVLLSDHLLDEAERYVAGRDFARAALAVNQLTLAVAHFQRFPAAKDRDVALLDYLGREVVLLNRVPGGKDAPTLKTRRTAVAAAWKRLRAGFAAIPKGHATVAAMDRCVADLQAGGAPAAQIAAGNRLLDLVDDLEKL
jgi:hypothetical protein